MATKNSESTKTTKSVSKTENKTSNISIEEAQALLAEIAKLKEQINAASAAQTVVSAVAPAEQEEKMIKFISLAKGAVLLKGSAARPYVIENQYESRSFTETEAKLIVSLMGSFMAQGYVYIDDADFVQKVGLSNAYKNMLRPDQLKALFEQSADSVLNVYQIVSDGQKKIIIDMIGEKIGRGETVDANILRSLSKLSGQDLLDLEETEE